MALFAAVVFDLDGTLVDSAADIQLVLNEVLADIGREPLTLSAVTAMIGDGPGKLLERALAAGGTDPDCASVQAAALVERFIARYDAMPVIHTRPYAGVAEALCRLKAEGARLGICSNKPEGATRAVLGQLGLAPLFGAIVGSGTLAGVQKPDARMLQATLAALGVDGASAVMVGDAAPDVGVARNAGVPVVIRAGGYSRQPAATLGADAVFETYGELPEVLAALRRQRC